MSAEGYTEFTKDTLQSPDGINQLNSIIRKLYDNMAGDSEGVRVFNGYGSPEGVITAGIGSLYLRVDGGTGTSAYFKESGDGNTGWVAKTNLSLPLSVANGGTGGDFSSTVIGNIPYFSATGVLSSLAPGTSGYFLKSNGTGAAPSYAQVTTASVVGDYLVSPATRLVSDSNSGYAKAGELYVARSGALRIKFWIKTGTGNGHGRIYRNGSAVGTDRTATGTWTEHSEDISGWTAGDLCQIYMGSGDGANTYFVGGMRIFEGAPVGAYNATAVSQTYTGNVTTPTGALGNIGDIYIFEGGGATTTLFVKTGATTWTAK